MAESTSTSGAEYSPMHPTPPPSPQRHPYSAALRWRVGVLMVAAATACVEARDLPASDWPDPDGDGYTLYRCDNAVGYCPADTPVLACHADGNRPQYANGTPCLNNNGEPARHGETCACDHPDGCYSDCRLTPPSCVGGQGCSMPDVVIEADRHYVFEHEEARFTLFRTGDAQDTLLVRVRVSESEDMVSAANEGSHMVSFAPDATATAFTAPTARDFTDEPHSNVAVTVVDNPGYRVSVPAAATVQVRDVDGRLVGFSVDPLSRSVAEGETAVFDAVATTVDDGTFETAADLTRVFGAEPIELVWITVSREATSGTDFHFLNEDVRIRFDQFETGAAGLSRRWTLPGIVTIADDEAEGDEELDAFLGGFPQVDFRLFPADADAVVTVMNAAPAVSGLGGGGPARAGSAPASLFQPATQPPPPDPARVYPPQSTATLIAPHRGIAELGPLTAFTSFRRMDLSGNAVANLSPLANQTNLNWLDMSKNAVADLSPLAALADLRYLKLSGNQVVELWPLANLSRLEVLFLDGNQVADVEPLWSMASLRYLVLDGNRIEDIDALAGLADLERLDLHGNPVTDLSPLAGLSRLKWLRVSADADLATAPPLLFTEGHTLLHGDMVVVGQRRGDYWTRR